MIEFIPLRRPVTVRGRMAQALLLDAGGFLSGLADAGHLPQFERAMLALAGATSALGRLGALAGLMHPAGPDFVLSLPANDFQDVCGRVLQAFEEFHAAHPDFLQSTALYTLLHAPISPEVLTQAVREGFDEWDTDQGRQRSP